MHALTEEIPRNVPFAAALLAATLVLCIPLTAEEAAQDMKSMRKVAAQRERRIIFDNDGNEPVYYCAEATKEALLGKRTTPLAGSQADSIFYCTWSSGFGYFTHDTKVGTVFDCTAEEPDKGPGSGFSKNKTRQFIDAGLDPLTVMVDFCKEKGIEIFWSMRMNDIHDAWGAWYSPFLFPPVKKEHPEYLLGTKEKRPKNGAWSAVDFGQSEIRDLAYRFFEEVCTNYDVDGVQLDFFRHLGYFRNPAVGKPATQAELDCMTELLRRIRVMADRRGAERGRPILISVRIPDSVPLCKNLGFDIETWLEEDLIDLMAVSGYFRLNPWETSVVLGKRYGVPVYPCLSETRLRDKTAAQVRRSLEGYRARAMNVWHAGAPGVYLFNFFNPNSPLWHELGAPETLAGLDKVYTTGARGFGNIDFWWEGGGQYMTRDIVNPAHPRAIAPGKAETVELLVGEVFPENPKAKITLQLRVSGLKDGAQPLAKANDTALEAPVFTEPYHEFAVPQAALHQGKNTFALQLPGDTAEAAKLEDLLLRVHYVTSP